MSYWGMTLNEIYYEIVRVVALVAGGIAVCMLFSRDKDSDVRIKAILVLLLCLGSVMLAKEGKDDDRFKQLQSQQTQQESDRQKVAELEEFRQRVEPLIEKMKEK